MVIINDTGVFDLDLNIEAFQMKSIQALQQEI
jgi:hypothetical protein